MREKIELLQEEQLGLQLAASHLGYATEKMLEIYSAVAALSPALLAAVPKVVAYAGDIIQRYQE